MKIKSEILTDQFLRSLAERMESVLEMLIKQDATIISTTITINVEMFIGVIFYKQ